MAAPYSILVLDLHNTLYDEAYEYGLAMEVAVEAWREIAPSLKRDTVFSELAEAHRELGSDWDRHAWRMLPSLKALNLPVAEFEKRLAFAEHRRKEKSRQLVGTGFKNVPETLRQLKKRGVPIYVVTEAAADAGMEIIGWLGLGGIVDGFYSYPSREAPPTISGTYHKSFADDGSGKHLRKPNPLLLAEVALDEAVRRKAIPAGLSVADVFEIVRNESRRLPELPPTASSQANICAQLKVKPGLHPETLQKLLASMLYVGDSKFKDGFLARNAGVAFAYAAYGKKVIESRREDHMRSLAIMYAVTGWVPEELKLTQEATNSHAVASLKPDYIFEDSLGDALKLFG